MEYTKPEVIVLEQRNLGCPMSKLHGSVDNAQPKPVPVDCGLPVG